MSTIVVIIVNVIIVIVIITLFDIQIKFNILNIFHRITSGD